MKGSQDNKLEDLAIQDTLSMTTEERLDLLANLLAEKIIKDRQNGDKLYLEIEGVST